MSDQRMRAKGAVKADVPRVFYSVREFAQAAGLAVDTVYRMIARGELGSIPLGGEHRIPVREVDRLIEAALAAVKGGAA